MRNAEYSKCYNITLRFHNISITGRSYPFNIGFKSDGFEAISAAIADMADDDEVNGRPGGILGFALGFSQGTC